jgi:hypothetical protein
MKRILSLGLLALLVSGSLSTAWADKRDDVLRKRAQINALIDKRLYLPGAQPRIWNGHRYVSYNGDPIQARYGRLPGGYNQVPRQYAHVPQGKAWGWHRQHPDFRANNRGHWQAHHRRDSHSWHRR